MTKKVSKITVKKVCQKIETPEKPTELMTVIGIVKKHRYTQSDAELITVFNGDFYAQNLSDKKTYVANRAVFPPPLALLLLEYIKAHEGEVFQFAVKLGMEPAQTLAGMEWTVDLFHPIQEYDPIAALVATIEGTTPPKRSKGNGAANPAKKQRTATRKPAKQTTSATRKPAKPKRKTAQRRPPVASHKRKITPAQARRNR